MYWCLAVTQTQFGVAPFAANARIAWEKNPTKHQDYNLPEGVWTTIFWLGDKNNYGHIACAKRTGGQVEIWSSPYTHKPYFDIFKGELRSTIDQITRVYGMSGFVGWTEVLNTTRLIELVPEVQPKPEPKPEPTPKPEETTQQDDEASSAPNDGQSSQTPEPEQTNNNTQPPTPPNEEATEGAPIQVRTWWQIVIDFIKSIFNYKTKGK
jgi:hypothetical protein